MKDFIQTTFKTSDGVKLSYLRAGTGLPIVLLHGSFGSGACFKSQAQILAEQYDVIVLDQRSHGESEKVPFGMKVARLSKDLFELITALNLRRISLLGHSMGAAVIWSYIELFGDAELSKLILIDRKRLINPIWRMGLIRRLRLTGGVPTLLLRLRSRNCGHWGRRFSHSLRWLHFYPHVEKRLKGSTANAPPDALKGKPGEGHLSQGRLPWI